MVSCSLLGWLGWALGFLVLFLDVNGRGALKRVYFFVYLYSEWRPWFSSAFAAVGWETYPHRGEGARVLTSIIALAWRTTALLELVCLGASGGRVWVELYIHTGACGLLSIHEWH